MKTLSPQQAAAIAKHVYSVRQESDLQTASELSSGLGISGSFSLGGSSRFEGTSGPMVFKKSSGFGYVAQGIGAHQGEALVAMRGTVTARDWGTDLNIGVQNGPTGHLVHAGFNDTFKSCVRELDDFFREFSPSHVHCVGHSLGGALATLAAAHLSQGISGGISLYTFGCPRVGVGAFSAELTNRLGADNIHRVYHDADPVSMIPIFPFAHIPSDDAGMRLHWSGGRITPSAHFMENYETGIGQSEWKSLRTPAAADWATRAQRLLDSASSDGALMFSAKVLGLIMQALRWILKKSATIVVGSALTVTATVLDQIAWLLTRGAALSKDIARYLGNLITLIFRFLGRAVSKAVSITAAFLRWVLDLLFGTIKNAVHRAIHLMPIF